MHIVLTESLYEIETNTKYWKLKTNAEKVLSRTNGIFLVDHKNRYVLLKEGANYQGEDGVFASWFYKGEKENFETEKTID